MRRNIVRIFIYVSVLSFFSVVCAYHVDGQAMKPRVLRGGTVAEGGNEIIPTLTANRPYVFEQRHDVLLGPLGDYKNSDGTPLAVDEVEIRISPNNDWNDKQATPFTNYNTKEFYSYNGNDYIKVLGNNVPTNYYLLMKVETDHDKNVSPYVLQAKSATHFDDLKAVLLTPLSVGLAGSVSVDGNGSFNVAPLVYYQFRWVWQGDEWWKHVLPSSVGVFLNPSLANFTASSSTSTLTSLLTFGAGAGFFDNIVLFGFARNFAAQYWEFVLALNLS